MLQGHGELVPGFDVVRVVDHMPVGALDHRIAAVEGGLRAEGRQGCA